MRAGIDHITGLGMFGEEDVLSCEALVIDNDIVGAEVYMDKGIEQKRSDAAADISFLADEAVIDPETIGYLRSDEYFVPRVFNRDRSKPMLNRAIKAVEDILAQHNPEYLSGEQQRGLESCLAQPNN
jgi:trimethylamine:corrinoid methyltransferase-like protein